MKRKPRKRAVNAQAVPSLAEAVLEIRRLSGLTWEEMGDLFGVSRRSVHYWANGKAVSAKHDRAIRRILAAIRHLDQGNQAGTRAQLLDVDSTTGMSAFDLLKAGRFKKVMSFAAGVRLSEPRRRHLSPKAQDVRRPPSPAHLLEAEQERPDIPAKARVATIAKSSGAG